MIKTERNNSITTLLLDRADKRNAIDWDMVHALAEGVAAAEKDANCRCLVIKGAGDHFAAGRDLGATKTQRTLETVLTDDDAWTEIFQGLRRMTKPSVAVVRGYAVAGGFTLAMGCDFVLADRTAKFGALEMRHGFPAAINTAILSALVGPRPALELLLSSGTFDAERLYGMGLINRLADDAAALAKIESEFVAELAGLDPTAVRLTKEAHRTIQGMQVADALVVGKHLNALLMASGRIDDAAKSFAKSKK